MSIKSTIEDLKLQTGALSDLDHNNRIESALLIGLLSNDLWDPTSYLHHPKERMRAANSIRNLIRHNSMMGLLDALLSAHLKAPSVPTPELLGSLAVVILEQEQEVINTPIAHLCAYLVHKIDQLEAKDKANANRNS